MVPLPRQLGGVCQFLRGQQFKSLTWVHAFRLALCHAPEIVGIAKAAAVKETLALLTPAVKEVTRHQASTGSRGLL